jgi:small subunit ribosomal protein S12
MPTINQLLKNPRKKKKKFISVKLLEKNPQKRGVCIKVYTTSPKKPNSAVRKVAKVKLCKSNKNILASIPGFGHNLSEHSIVLVRGGRVPDLPGIRYKLIRGKYDFSSKETQLRSSRRSKFGISLDKEKKKKINKNI